MSRAAQEAEDRKILSEHVKKPYARLRYHDEWRNLPELPTRSEVMPEAADFQEYKHSEDTDTASKAELPVNPLVGSWPSKEAYIGTHYQILREDAIGSLRDSIATFKAHPDMQDDGSTCIYTHVHFKGIQVCNQGVGFRVEFSYERAGKRIRWEQSKRLQQGSLLALTPQSDCFQSICKLATVAARPIRGGLDQNPPSIDIFWATPEDAEFQPGEPWIIVESRMGYFEASRHMLVALQKVMTEDMPLQDYVLTPPRDQVTERAPEHLKDRSMMDLRSLIMTTVPPEHQESAYAEAEKLDLDLVDVLDNIPDIPNTGLDISQKTALSRMLTDRFAIVQGPPGTGKTFVSVAALIVMMDNWTTGDPPIIVSAQTNHALDQLLNHILPLEEDILRLGGRSDRENVEIQKRTMYELKQSCKEKTGGSSIKASVNQIKARLSNFQEVLNPFLGKDPIMDELLRERGILTQEQYDSLQDDNWVEADEDQSFGSKILLWLGNENLVPLSQTPAIDMGLEEEAIDLEFEQLQEMELENGEPPEPDDADALRGTWVPFLQEWTGRQNLHGTRNSRVRRTLEKTQNLWKIKPEQRGEVYRYLVRQLYLSIRAAFREHLKEYTRELEGFRIARELMNLSVVRSKNIKLVGCTTTGLSKYRAFIAALKPRILLIEEAAETLEGTVAAALFGTLEQLILVGDHKQLQANCTNPILQKSPYNLGKSMFERLINNNVKYIMLQRQRRMIPAIRELLCMESNPIYPDLQDHPSVLDRESNRMPVEGMGGLDTYFFHHNWQESKDNDASRYNMNEAEMIAKFFLYLVLNGVPIEKITILTFYNGQRKTILRQLRKVPILKGETYFNVFTVDSYQGEENDIILLSLVRSNNHLGIGFLENQNRLVVSLSRARRGLYIFGNAVTIAGTAAGAVWDQVFRTMCLQGRASSMTKNGNTLYGLIVTCKTHGNITEIFEPDDWVKIQGGGCELKCDGALPCGHPCPLTCHPISHENILCKEACEITLHCGHKCSETCGALCRCAACAILARKTLRASPDINTDASEALEVGTSLVTLPRFQQGDGRSLTKSKEGAASKWKVFDARKQDKEIAEQKIQERAAQPVINESDFTFKATYHQAIVENGVRKVIKGKEKTIRAAPRAPGSNENKSPAQGTIDSDLATSVSKLDITTDDGKSSGESTKVAITSDQDDSEDLISFD